MLGQPDKQQQVAQDILTEVTAGVLMPGDRLVGVRKLCHRYEAGQRLVTAALEDLEAAGVIERRDRSGCYVRPGAADRAADLLAAARRRPPSIDPLTHYLPRSGGDQVRLLISEVYPQLLSIWRQVVAEFEAGHAPVHVELQTVAGGHPELLMARDAVDVVLATPPVLAESGWPAMPVGDLTAFDLRPDDLLPPLADYARGAALPGVPFSLTVPLLYAAADWEIAGDPLALLRCAAGAYRPAWLSCLLLQAGILTIAPDGRLSWNREGLAEAIRLSAGVVPAGTDTKAEWLAGRIGAFEYYSFFLVQARQRRRTPWAARPVPLAPGCQAEAMALLLAVNGESRCLPAALDLVTYLTQPAIQARFAAAGGNLPARTAVWRQARAAGAWGAASAGVAAALDRSCLRLQVDPSLARLHADFGLLSKRLYAGDLGPAAALARAELLLNNTNLNLDQALAS